MLDCDGKVFVHLSTGPGDFISFHFHAVAGADCMDVYWHASGTSASSSIPRVIEFLVVGDQNTSIIYL